ncbi:hypothetical protein [Larkinella rosea]|uniref:Uncharacterized protein n=1 Tax=Larkinella rosea TaxID=2025312 RepID=A0A3P1BFZ0_9BACT|nr:hypothetical protein [Larkinella rosea]RRB00010.1 hypothetical protein EHT25_25635 [Larkinella rosea]
MRTSAGAFHHRVQRPFSVHERRPLRISHLFSLPITNLEDGTHAIHRFVDFTISNRATDVVQNLSGYDMPRLSAGLPTLSLPTNRAG